LLHVPQFMSRNSIQGLRIALSRQNEQRRSHADMNSIIYSAVLQNMIEQLTYPIGIYCCFVRQEVTDIWSTGYEIVVSKEEIGSGAQRKGKFLAHRFLSYIKKRSPERIIFS